MSTDVEIVRRADAEEAARDVAERLADAARAGHEIALAGGSSPRRAYELAAFLAPDWSRVGLWWGDERCVPPGDHRSNYGLARSALLDRLSRLPQRIHRIKGELPAERAAAEYDEELRGAGAPLDVVLLGIGPDGHTASLFPGDAALEERERPARAVHALGIDRVTLTLPALNAAHTVVFLAVGEDKAAAVAAAFGDEPGPAVPASLVRGAERTVAVLDAAAAAGLRT
jgi:6-phosphogluconolactonase